MSTASANSTAGPGGEFIVEDLELTECGAFRIICGNFGTAAKSKIKLKILPFQPKRGKGKLYLK